MATHKGHFRWYNEEEIYGKKQWTRIYFVLKIEESALYIYKQKKDQAKEWKKVDISKGSCKNGHHNSKKHVFVFTANDQREYIFRSEHKNKKKQWVRYLNEAAQGAPKKEKPKVKEEEKKPEPVKQDESSPSDSSSSDSSSSDEGENEEAEAEAAKEKKKKAEEEAEAARSEKEAQEVAAAAEAERKRKEAEDAEAERKRKEAEEAEAERKRKEAEEAEAEAEAERKRKEAEDAEAERKRKEAEEAEAEAERKRKEAEEEEEAKKKAEEEESDSSSSDSEAEPEVGKNVTVENTYPRLLHLQGKKKTDITITHVPATAASVNDSDVFILDNNKTIYTWLGASPNMWQKQAAAALARALDDERSSDVANLVLSNATSSDAAKFWELLGDKPEQLSKAAPEGRAPVLFQLSDASGKMVFTEVARGNPLKRSLLNPNDVFIADLGFHIFVWIGKKASRDERDKAVGYAVVYRQKYKRPEYIHVERVMDGGENEVLYSFFTQ